MNKLFKIILIGLLVVCSLEISTAQTYFIKGSQYSAKNKLTRFEIVPKTGTIKFNWLPYSDTTVQRISVPEVDTSLYYTKTSARSGIIKCEIRDIATDTLIDTLKFQLKIVKNHVDISSLAGLSLQCANIGNDNNLCQTNYIDYFELKDIKFNNNGCVAGGYQDLTTTDLTTSLDMGLKYTVTLRPKNIYLNAASQPSTLFYGMWIDYNNDGDFDDPGEFVKEGESSDSTANFFNVEILNNDSYAGNRRLRVAMNSSSGFSSSGACAVISSAGEIEDYVVTIVKVGGLYGPNFITPNNDGYNDFLVIKGIDPDTTKSRELEIYDTFGQKVRFIKGYGNDYEGTDENGKTLPTGIYYYRFVNESRELKSYFELKY